VIRFGEFELDIGSGELRRRGRRVRLGPQPLEALAALIATPGEIVSREALRKRIWSQGTYVDFEHGINFCIREIRSKLGTGSSPPFPRCHQSTLPRRKKCKLTKFMSGLAKV
jgi:cholera toxin transcriptional activator